MPHRQRSEKWKIRKAERRAARKAARRAERRAASRDALILPLKAASKAASGAACYFLQIPLEIRIQIYRYLFIHPRHVFLDKDLEKDVLEDAGTNFIRRNRLITTAFDDAHDHSVGDRGKSINDDLYAARYQAIEDLFVASQVSRVKRHLSILRTNRQIYDEASALLHSDLTIGVSPGYALALTPNPGNAVVSQSTKLWQPLEIIRRSVPITQRQTFTVYEPSLPDDFMKPHVFAQFEKLHYSGHFDFFYDASAPTIYINDDLSTRAEDETKFVSYLTTASSPTQLFEGSSPCLQDDICIRRVFKQTLKDAADVPISSISVTHPTTADVFRKLGDLLSTSSFIRELEFGLEVSVNMKTWLDEIYPEEDGYWEQQGILDQRARAANERATELFLESGVLDPLRKLSNVKSFSLKIYTEGPRGLIMRPKKRYLSMMDDLKKVIEKNWDIKHGSR